MKCENCNAPIPKEKEKYAKGMRVCGWCYNHLRKGNRKNKHEIRMDYLNWLSQPNTYRRKRKKRLQGV